jgi:hypothetical protein
MPVGRYGVVERALQGAQHLAIGQLRQQRIDRVVETQRALLDQDHRRGGHDRLCHRRDTKDRVAPHWIATVEHCVADDVDVRLAPPADQRDETGKISALHVTGHGLVHALEPCFGKCSLAHRLQPSCSRIRS